VSALADVVARIDANSCGEGYVTNLAEVKRIGAELTDSVPVSVLRECEDDCGLMGFRVTLHFSVSREEIWEARDA
jgi:hypothetical protein